MAIILCYFTECGSFGGQLCQSGRRQKCGPNNLVLWLMAIFTEVNKKRWLKWTHPIHVESNTDSSTTGVGKLLTLMKNFFNSLDFYSSLKPSAHVKKIK